MAGTLQAVLLCALIGLCWSNPQYLDDQSQVPAGAGQCGYSLSYDCVPYFQCIDGVINTDGVGLIDVRIRPTGHCSNPDYPDVPAICCLIPGEEPTPAPLTTCYDSQECVDIKLCSASGYIVDDGAGLIDIRAGHTSCYQYDGQIGVCCTPSPVILDKCPYDSVCTDLSKCALGKALDISDQFIDYISTGSWQECYLPYENIGICCQEPAPLDTCPEKSYCAAHGACNGRALSGPNNFLDYVQDQGAWSSCHDGLGGYGVCCQPNPVDSCPYESECIYNTDCYGTAMNHANVFEDYFDTGIYKWTTCKRPGQDYGICCKQISPYVDCPTDSVCTGFGQCTGTAMDFDGSFVNYDPIGVWAECDYSGTPGICCKAKPIPSAAKQCGIRNYEIDQRIQAGEYAVNEANFGEFPWQAIIFFQNYTFKCGASLISDRHVLTGAHCVNHYAPGDIRLRFGEWAVNKFDEPLPDIDRNVRKIYIHEKYNHRNLHNDIAVLELYEPVPLAYHINSICIPGPGQIPTAGYRCFASGWGKDSFDGNFQSILKKIDLPWVYHDECQNLLRRTRLGRRFRLDKSFVCAGGEENKDACFGDGGGPLVCKDDKTHQYFLQGITAWGIGCGTKDIPGVYVNVAHFYDWITKIVNGGTWDQVQAPVQNYGR